MRRPDIGLVASLRRAATVAPSLTAGIGLTIVLTILGTVGQLVVPVAVQQLLDAVAADAARAELLGIGGVAVVAVLIALVANRVAMWRLLRAAASGLAELRVATFRHIHRLSTLHVQSERRGSLVARVTSDIEVVTQFVEWGGVGLLVGTAQLTLVLLVMTVYDPILAAVVAGAGALYAALLVLFQRVLRRRYDQVRERSATALAAVSEAISGLPTIRAYGAEARTLPRVDARLEEARRSEVRAQVLAASMFSSAEVFAGGVTALVIGIGVAVQPDQLTAGRLVAFLFLVTLFIEPIQLLVEVLDQAQTAAAGIRRVLAVLDTAVEVEDPVPGRSLPPGPIAVEVEDLWFAYPRGEPGQEQRGDPVLRAVDLTLPAGTRVAVVGETGSGKSTFVKLLTRLFDPTRGRILLGGVPLDEIAFSSLRARVISVPQDGFLFDATVADNIRYGAPDASDEEVLAACRELDLADWLAELPEGIHTEVGERGNRLSAGERQLVALVRAWIARPDLLVLDEATSAVDPALEVRLRRAIERLTSSRTSITVAHRLSTAEAADEVLVFDRGELVQRGPHARLVAEDGVYRRLHADWAAGTTAS
ncbi:MAG: ABC transporter ATP-binding protein [Nitriliruptoraceae bacterium]